MDNKTAQKKAALFAASLLLSALMLPPSAPLAAERLHHDPQDQVLRQIGVDEKHGAQIPLDLVFTDKEGKSVRLGDYFTGEPVILTLNYYDCPMLCPLIFRNLITTMNGIKGFSLGKDFRIVTVSFNPEETLDKARAKATETYGMLRGVALPESRWPFLMGKETSIVPLAKSVGFRYAQVGKGNFAHPAVIMVITPKGRIARYLYGLEQDPRDLKLALIEAAGGRIGGSELLNRALLYCFHYDPVGKKYALAALNVMKIAGGTVLLLLGILLLALWRREKRGSGKGEQGPGTGN
ncbi:MAG: hypothetical protein FD174_3856 [Geobacteraceae bacterium]|nr:MAG: hypothetical protein FD174_3856 [Geobacteraceae bacterium]